MNLGMGGGQRAMRVLDKARAQQVEMEKREQSKQKALENIYLSNAKSSNIYDGSGSRQSTNVNNALQP